MEYSTQLCTLRVGEYMSGILSISSHTVGIDSVGCRQLVESESTNKSDCRCREFLVTVYYYILKMETDPDGDVSRAGVEY